VAAIGDRIGSIDKLVATLSEQAKKINITDETEHLEKIRDIFIKKLSIRETAMGLIRNSEVRLSSATLPAASTIEGAYFTAVERTAKAPVGYYELLNNLFHYQEDPEREKAFLKAKELMPPKRMAMLLNDSLGLGFVPPLVLNMNNVLASIRMRTNSKALNEAEFSIPMLKFVDDLINRALAA